MVSKSCIEDLLLTFISYDFIERLINMKYFAQMNNFSYYISKFSVKSVDLFSNFDNISLHNTYW